MRAHHIVSNRLTSRDRTVALLADQNCTRRLDGEQVKAKKQTSSAETVLILQSHFQPCLPGAGEKGDLLSHPQTTPIISNVKLKAILPTGCPLIHHAGGGKISLACTY